MTNAEAKRRYFRIFIPAMIIFLGACFTMAWFRVDGYVRPPTLYAVALIPIVALLSVFWAHWRLMQEIDEFLRAIQMQAVMAGLAVVLLIATGWGFLEMYTNAPRLDVFWLNPIFWLAYAAGASFFTWRATGQLE